MTAPKSKNPGGSLEKRNLNFNMRVLGILAAVLVVLFLSEGVLTAAGKLLIYSDPPHTADAIVVLSGGGLPRLEEAARLYKEKQAPYIILTETGIITEKYGELSQIEKGQLVDMDIQPQAIFITDMHVDSTTDEARVIRKLLNTKGFKSAVIVTDTFHSRRTHLVFQDAFKGNDLTVYIKPVRDDWYIAATWWTSLEGWQVTLPEASKLIIYFFSQHLFH
jgi:uncharacterized SAM-binding protein YcdF (DUF218 family)